MTNPRYGPGISKSLQRFQAWLHDMISQAHLICDEFSALGDYHVDGEDLTG